LLLLEHAVCILEAAAAGLVRPAHLDFELLVTSPELSSQRYVGLVAFWALMRKASAKRLIWVAVVALCGVALTVVSHVSCYAFSV